MKAKIGFCASLALTSLGVCVVAPKAYDELTRDYSTDLITAVEIRNQIYDLNNSLERNRLPSRKSSSPDSPERKRFEEKRKRFEDLKEKYDHITKSNPRIEDEIARPDSNLKYLVGGAFMTLVSGLATIRCAKRLNN